MGKGTLFQPQPSPGAGDTQGTKRDLQHRGWASSHCWGVPAQILPCARVTLCAANSGDGATGDAASWTQRPALPAAPSACQGDGEPLGQSLQRVLWPSSPHAPCPEGGILLLTSQELQKFCGAWGQPAAAPFPLHPKGTQGCSYPARPLNSQGMEKQDIAPIKRGETQVVKRTGGLYCCDRHGPSVLAPSWPMGKDRAIWGRHRGSPAASARAWARGGGGGKGRKVGKRGASRAWQGALASRAQQPKVLKKALASRSRPLA